MDESTGYDVNSEVPVKIVHVPPDGQCKRKRSQSLLNQQLSKNLTADCTVTRKQIIETSNANEACSGLGNMDFVIGPPYATSSPIR